MDRAVLDACFTCFIHNVELIFLRHSLAAGKHICRCDSFHQYCGLPWTVITNVAEASENNVPRMEICIQPRGNLNHSNLYGNININCAEGFWSRHKHQRCSTAEDVKGGEGVNRAIGIGPSLDFGGANTITVNGWCIYISKYRIHWDIFFHRFPFFRIWIDVYVYVFVGNCDNHQYIG